MSDELHIWLRAEQLNTKAARGTRSQWETDRRSALAPHDCASLCAAGFRVTVERSQHRIFPDQAFQEAGCSLVAAGTWVTAPPHALIVGVRALRQHNTPLMRRHVYYGHAFKGQPGSNELMARYLRGNGVLLDCEYLVNGDGKRLVTFGHNAGRIALAAGVLAWCRQVMAQPGIGVVIPDDMIAKLENLPLVQHIKALLQTTVLFAKGRQPTVVIIGNGTTGADARKFCDEIGLKVDVWTRKETESKQGPHDELLNYEILVNAIKLDTRKPPSPFVTRTQLHRVGKERRLSVLVDISCDTSNRHNPVPIYDQSTTFNEPTMRVIEAKEGVAPLDIIAIPTLPSLVPLQSTTEFSAKLTPLLLEQYPAYLKGDLKKDSGNVWERAERIFKSYAHPLLPTPLDRSKKFLPLSKHQQYLQKLIAAESTNSDDSNNGALSGYNVSSAFDVPADLSKLSDKELQSKLSDAMEFVAARHEMLRAAVDPRGVRILNKTSIPVRLVPCAHEDDFQTRAKNLSQQVLNARNGKSWTLDVLRVGDASGPVRILLVAHRLVADSASLVRVADELLAHLAGKPLASTSQVTKFDFLDVSGSWWASAGDLLQQTSLRAQDKSILALPPQEREALRQDAMSAALTYWRGKLKWSPPVLQVPLDRTRPARTTFESASVRAKLPADVVSKLVTLDSQITTISEDERKTAVAGALLAAYVVLLARLSGENDLVLGTLVSGRDRPGAADVIGPLSNWLVLRIGVERSSQSFLDVLRATTRELLSAIAHQDMPFATLLEALGDQARMGNNVDHTPLFTVLFVLASQLGNKSRNNNQVALQSHCAPHDLALIVDDCVTEGEDVSIELRYNRRLFASERMSEMLRQMVQLLTLVIDKPSDNIMSFDLVTPQAKQILPQPTTSALDGSWLGSVTGRLTDLVKKQSDIASRVAVSYCDSTLTYGELEELTNKLANRLVSQGVKRADVVAIYGHRSPAVVVAIIGVLKAGAAYSMIDPQYPTDRIAACLSIASPSGWLAIEAAGQPPADLQEVLEKHGFVSMLCLPPVAAGALTRYFADDKGDAAPSDRAVTPDDIAVVTFTSGSTGLPKGVRGRHVPLTHFYPWMAEEFDIGADDRFAMCSGIAHDPLQRDLFTPLFFGAPIHVPTQDDIVQPGRLAQWMRRENISVACLTPAMGQLLVTVDDPTFELPELRAVFFVGDLLIKRDVQRLRRLAPYAICINMYGSTETQRAVGYYVVEPGDDMADIKEVVPVGVGMKDVEMLILNDQGLLCGVSEVGEIYVRSPHIARDYVGLPEQSAARFTLNPFAESESVAKRNGDRMYKTGDLGRYMHDGCVECLGRADDQVKVRGFRIELGEINAHLSQHDRVRTTVTVVRKDGGEKMICSYVVPTAAEAGQAELSSLELIKSMKTFLGGRLPHYMVPRHIVLLESMPLTPNGKINRKALPSPKLFEVEDEAPVRALTDTEDTLIQVWTKLLDVTSVPLDGDFFELGGHSILATRVVLQASRAFKTALPMSCLLSHPTVESMAHAIDKFLGSDEAGDGSLAVGDDAAALALAAAGEEEEAIDLQAEAVLPDDVQLDAAARAALANGFEDNGEVLLTGASGFLGAFLLVTLLERTQRRILCHVRAKDAKAGFQRLERSLRAHLLWKDEYAARIVALPGDLAKAGLGMNDSDVNLVARSVSLIIHNGALVHWLLPYSAMKQVNVGGTLEVLRLAGRQRPKRVCYVSTTSVFDDTEHCSAERIEESDDLSSVAGLNGGYPQSKWVADRLVMAARERGFSTCVVRPGYVGGDSERGVWNVDDFLARLLKGCVQLGASPAIDADAVLDVTPVDVVAGVVVGAALSDAQSNLNVVNPQRFPYQGLFQALQEFGYDVPTTTFAEWRHKLHESIEKSTFEDSNDDEEEQDKESKLNALAPLLSVLNASWADGLVASSKRVYGNEQLLKLCKSFDVAFPDMAQVLPVYFGYFIKCRFVPPPEQPPSNDLGIDWKLIGDSITQVSRSGRAQE